MTPVARTFGPVNTRGVWSLYLREIRRGLKLAIITLVAPAIRAILFATVFALVIESLRGDVAGPDFLAFLVPGLIAAAMFERAFEGTAFSVVYDKLEHVIDDVVRAPLTAAEILVAYSLAATTSALMVGVVVGVVLLPYNLAVPAAPLILLLSAAAGAYMISLFALIAGLWAQKWDHISAAQTFVVIPVIFLSGVFFSIERLPPLGQSLVRANPVFYVVDGVRYGMTGRGEGDPTIAIILVGGTIVALLAVCYRLLVTGYRLKD